jgi:hypothetical protein
MNMFLHELKAYGKSTLIWSLSMAAVTIVFLSLYPSVANDAQAFRTLLQNYPESVLKAFGIALDNITSFIGFYSYIFLYVVLCGSIQAMNLGTSVISKEVRAKTADFLLTKPVSRKQIFTAKLTAILTALVVTNVFYMAVASAMARIVSSAPYDHKIFFMINITLLFVQLLFLALGVLISVILPKVRSVLSITLTVVLGLFTLNMFSSVLGEETVRYITPFKYYDTAYIIKNSSYEISFIITEIIFVVLSILISLFIYSKKDIHAV